MIGNWIRQTTTTTGTGDLTLASVSGYPTFDGELGQGARFEYAILDDSTGAPLETGIGYLSGSTTLVRERVQATMVSGTYNDINPTAVSLAAGTKRVIAVHEAGSNYPGMRNLQGSFGARIVIPEGMQLSGGSNKTLTANVPFASCLRWPGGMRISQLVALIGTAAGTGSDRMQLGIYAQAADGGVGPLICRTGDILPNSSGLKTASLSSGSNLRLPPGWYWFVICCSAAAVVGSYAAGGANVFTECTPMGRPNSTDFQRGYVFFTCTSLGSGWTVLPSTVTLSTAVQIQTDYAPIVAAVVV